MTFNHLVKQKINLFRIRIQLHKKVVILFFPLILKINLRNIKIYININTKTIILDWF